MCNYIFICAITSQLNSEWKCQGHAKLAFRNNWKLMSNQSAVFYLLVSNDMVLPRRFIGRLFRNTLEFINS